MDERDEKCNGGNRHWIGESEITDEKRGEKCILKRARKALDLCMYFLRFLTNFSFKMETGIFSKVENIPEIWLQLAGSYIVNNFNFY